MPIPTLTRADAACGTASTANAAAVAINSPLRRFIFITCDWIGRTHLIDAYPGTIAVSLFYAGPQSQVLRRGQIGNRT
uniref:Uncharacterized protein n=1 Tax=Ralstonia solanacearum TaxID=305 RepID=A0A0S4XIW6_RALSL|nr:exported protein of unknown function [Ralstonia solanacearum]CUV38617.1 exported protein of unknown function [Ralstonia solanacearum]CUV44364.1 exported protein of unknown function [Ralstonia solanacearum]CUV56252.1 exported protein of unknown function [Ralstonia solanacearum]CUV63857.1 exported protein of unknown function [Ralstonia solanacearum]